MNYYKDLPRYVVAEKKRKGKHILNIFFKILPDHYHLHYYYRIIHQKKEKINNIKATLIRIIHHTYID